MEILIEEQVAHDGKGFVGQVVKDFLQPNPVNHVVFPGCCGVDAVIIRSEKEVFRD
mgnify:CR=1 FL=1